MHIKQTLAAAVLPILRKHAAPQLRQGNAEAKALADQLQAGRGNACGLSALEQNTDGPLPGTLDNFHRVLNAFEENAHGGELGRDGEMRPHRGPVEQPRPWMLHEAAAGETTVVDKRRRQNSADAIPRTTTPNSIGFVALTHGPRDGTDTRPTTVGPAAGASARHDENLILMPGSERMPRRPD